MTDNIIGFLIRQLQHEPSEWSVGSEVAAGEAPGLNICTEAIIRS